MKQKEELRQTREQQNNTTRNFFSTNNTGNNITLQREVEKHERIANELKKRLVALQGDYQRNRASISDYEKQVSELNDTVNWLTGQNQRLKQQLEPFCFNPL